MCIKKKLKISNILGFNRNSLKEQFQIHTDTHRHTQTHKKGPQTSRMASETTVSFDEVHDYLVSIGCDEYRATRLVDKLIKGNISGATDYYESLIQSDDKDGKILDFIANFDGKSMKKSIEDASKKKKEMYFFKKDKYRNTISRKAGETYEQKYGTRGITTTTTSSSCSSRGGELRMANGVRIGEGTPGSLYHELHGKHWLNTGDPNQKHWDEHTHNFDGSGHCNPEVKMVDGGIGFGIVRPRGYKSIGWYGF